MALTFNALLDDAGVAPAEVRLLRHQTQGGAGRTPYSLWRDDRSGFLTYQSLQTAQNRSRLAGSYWASFVVTPAAATLFVGLYEVSLIGDAPDDLVDPLRHKLATKGGARPLDLYAQRSIAALEDLVGRVTIDWGAGTRSWIQRAGSQSKPILELSRSFQEEAFPGYVRFLGNLSTLEALPKGWIAALTAARGVYLLTCPRTREQYVGSATGESGFFGRWLSYAGDGHGGNVGLKSRDPSDYQVSILEVSGSSATVEEIIGAEQLWKTKLQSREMGLNRN
jgi:hypothetical protein